MAGAIDPTGGRKEALDAFIETKLREGFEVETHTDTHAVVVERGRGRSLLNRVRARGAANRYVVSVDEHAEVTMVPAEPKRS
jgi:phytoene dehydrogenase-like protein